MAVEIVPFKQEHGLDLWNRGALTYLTPYVTDGTFRNLEGKCAFTAIRSGEVLYCGGFHEWWPGRAEAWGFFDRSVELGTSFVAIHRAAVRLTKVVPYRRIEAVVDSGFEPGHRWALSLGFKLEAAVLRSYTVDERDVSLYAKIREV